MWVQLKMTFTEKEVFNDRKGKIWQPWICPQKVWSLKDTMSALHHHHHLSVAPLSRHTVSGLQFRSLLTSDLWPSDAVFLVYAAGKKQSPMQVFFLLLLFFYRVSVKSRCFCVCSVHLTFVKRCLLFCFFFCLFVEAFPRLRLLHFLLYVVVQT